jgi:hypothetical protein
MLKSFASSSDTGRRTRRQPAGGRRGATTFYIIFSLFVFLLEVTYISWRLTVTEYAGTGTGDRNLDMHRELSDWEEQ